jgi:hypothetical protein
MRRLLAFLSVAALALIALPSGAGAEGADIYGVGGGSISDVGQKFAKFAFSGHTGPGGDFGQFRVTLEDPNAPLDVHVDVNCLKVFPFPPGAGGYMSGPVKKVSPQPNFLFITPGDELLLGFNDFGEPSDPVPDELNLFFEPAQPQSCRTFPPLPHIPIDQGNIVVKLG